MPLDPIVSGRAGDISLPWPQWSAVVGNVLVYRDEHHITATYSRTMAPVFLEPTLRAAARRENDHERE